MNCVSLITLLIVALLAVVAAQEMMAPVPEPEEEMATDGTAIDMAPVV